MDIRTLTRGLLIRTGLLLVALAVFTIFINLPWFDESLDPELARLSTPRPVPMEGNSYPLIYGFAAANDKDPRLAGIAIIEELREDYRQGKPIRLGADGMALLDRGRDQSWRAGLHSLRCNLRVSVDCADGLIAEVASVAADPRLQVLLDRYEQILRVSRFQENDEFEGATPVPPYGLLMEVGRIRLAQRYRSEPTGRFLETVAGDMAFWRLMLRDGQFLIAKMVALAGIRSDLDFLSAVIRNRELDDKAILSIRQSLQPLTSEERDIGEAFLSECRVAMLSGKALILSSGDAMHLMVQNRATLNEFYMKTITPIRVRASLDAQAFYEQHGYELIPYQLRVFPPPLYNLGGKLLLKRQAELYNIQDYISRVHDLEGRMTLVLLQTEIEQNPAQPVQAVASASAYRNPYTREPMEYHAQAGTIGFSCLSNPEDVCAVAIGKSRAAASLPLDRRWRLAADVVDHARHALHLVHDPA